MEFIDIILSVILLLIIGGALAYIIKAKKRGEKCIGCPYSKECSKKSCNSNNETSIDIDSEEM